MSGELPGGQVNPVTLRVSEHGEAALGSFYEKIGGRASHV